MDGEFGSLKMMLCTPCSLEYCSLRRFSAPTAGVASTIIAL